jgi:ubiquinone biosynthesis protein UbiJ
MSNRITLIAILVLVLFTTNIQAQNAAATQPPSVSPVTGSVTPEGVVRMIAHGETLQIRMEGNTSIGVQDLTGVSLAAIKELDKRTTEVEQLREEVNQLRQVNSDLERRLATLEQLMKLH